MSKIPKLRFKEFSGNWEEKVLDNIATFSKGKGISKADIDENGTIECIRYGQLYTIYNELIKDIVSKTNVNENNLVLSNYGDIIIPASGETQIDIATASCILKDNVALGGDLNIIRAKEDGVFLSYYLNNAKKFDIARLSQGISVVHLYSSQLKTLKLNLPQKQEQEKIASFLTSVDTKIEQLTKKETLLKEYKKGVMQKIFNQEIRFVSDDGNEFCDWEEKKLGNLCKITTGKLDANAMNENGAYRFYTCAKEYFKINEYAFDTDALIVSGNGANVGYIHHYKGKFNAYQRTYVLDGFKDVIFFLKYVLDKYLYKRIMREKNEGNTPYIVMGTLADMMVSLPCLKEQTKIANFLSSIDTKIEQTQKKLESSKEFKKALLQQMFV